MRMMENVKMMPDVKTIVARMSEVAEDASDVGHVINSFARKIASSEKVPHGVNIAFQFAIYDVSQMEGAIPMLNWMMNLRYDDYMVALFPDDPAFAQLCIDIHNKVESEVRRRLNKS